MDMKLEVVPIPVHDVDAAKDFYTRRVGFHLDHDGGVAISEVQQMGPKGTPGSRYCFFEDPDRNMWAVQEYKRT